MRPYRKQRIASVVRNVVSDAIARRMQDPRLSPMVTVTRVEVTGDLQIAKVYLSLTGGEAEERKTIAAMQHAAGFIQRLLASELSIRHCPELRFMIDEGLKNARKTMELLEDNRRKNPELFEHEKENEGERTDAAEQSGEPDHRSTRTPNGGNK